MKRIILAMAVSLLALASHAKEAVPLAEDPVVEQRLIAISEDMRCLVCQNESLAASRSDLAQDLRRELRELIRQGKSDEEIKTFMVSRYGDFVLYKPPVKPTTWLLWIGPFVLMIGAIVGFFMYVRRRSQEGDDDAKEEFA
jgi:cytochrome c-type biogenesis protein CcmH